MFDILYLIGGGAACFIIGVIVSQKVKDWVAGVPAHVRADLSEVEVSALAQIKHAQATVLADVKAKVAPPVPVLKTAAPV